MKKFLFLLVMLTLALVGGWLAWQRVHPPPAPTAKALPTLPKPAREFRFAVLGRPSELPLHALSRMPELQDLPIKFVVCKSPAERWLMLASGQVDVVIASSDELAMALPRFGLDVNVFPMARHQGNEQMVFSKDAASPPWVAYLPGGVSQSLAFDLKDPQLKLLALDSPDQATAMLKAGQIRGCALWNPWLDQAKGQGYEVKGSPSSSLEVWVWGNQGTETGRISQEDGYKVVRAWFDLMRQLAEQPELTQRAIGEENETDPSQIPAALRGLEFYSGRAVLANKVKLGEELRIQMRDKVNLWSLAGQPIGGDIAKLQVDLDWLGSAGLDGDTSVVSPPDPSSESPTPTLEETAAPPDPPPGDGDPFDKPQGVGSSPASQAGGDASRSGRLPGPPLISDPQQLWSTSLPAEPTTAAVASPDGQQLFVGLANGNLSCLERASGRVMWNYAMSERIRSAPACQGQWVQVACDSGSIVSIDRATGQKRWATQASSDVVGPLAISDGALFAATDDGQVLCLELGSGSERWSQSTGTNITAGVAVTPEHVIACGIDKKVRAFNKEDGSTSWEVTLGQSCRATPSVESGLVMVGCADHNFYGLREYDGSVAWKQKLPDEVACGSVSLGRNVYVGCTDTVYVVSQDMRLYGLDATQGKLRFKIKLGAWLQTPWVQDRVAYLPVADNTVKALK